MTAPQRRTTVPDAVGENRKRIRILEAVPQLIALRPPQMMGNVQSGIAKTVAGKQVRSRGGLAFRADEERPLVNGDTLWIDYFQDADEFDQLSLRCHLATGLVLTGYDPRQPWQSDPWAGGASTGGNTLAPLANWDGAFYTFVGVCDSPGATIHFQTGGGSINADEDYGWDTPSGHIGYLFHNATVSDATNMTVTASAGSIGPCGFVRMNRGTFTGTVVSTMLGEVDDTNTRQTQITLSADVPTGDCVLVMVASEDDNIAGIGDAAERPNVSYYFPEKVAETPHYFVDGYWLPILAPSERLGTGELD